ncbi:hypothetical protein [Enterococcus wangshanyuanii]|uniref:hypothetical protein n=2 Tax=Enterococcus wangshanyuanii TaxID=2005703 RepID=UPI000B4A7E8A|nr:hypothetical protein [Enterococcus wangshanyuanii]
MKLNEQLKKMSKKQKMGVLTIGIAVLLVGSFGYKTYADKQKALEQERIAKIEKEQQAEERQLKIDTETAVNDLFEKAIIDNKDAEKIAIKNDLKSDTVKKVKEQYFVEKTDDAWQKIINESIVNAENQLKQIDTAKKAVEKVFKDNKVVNTDQKNVDSAKKEVDKIKNAKAKKELSDKLAKVKSELEKKNKEKDDKKKEAEKDSQQSPEAKTTTNDVAQTTNGAEQQVANVTGQQTHQAQQQTPQAGAGQETGYYEPQAPATNNDAGSNQNVAPTTPTPPAPEPTPEPTQPAGPPAGWITPPFPIGSAELGGWIFDNGYSGYDSSDGYIRPY